MSRIGARVFAAIYDRMLRDTEEAGLREHRRAIVGQARGRVLEIGAGTGLNLPHYGPEATELVLSEPEEPMARRLRARATKGEVVDAGADDLPFPDDSFDTVVSTLVLCTVPDQERALAEVKRVLKPDGRLLFLEHVRSNDPKVAKWQDRMLRPWRFVGHGCHCNRDTAAALTRAGFEVELQAWRMPKAPSIVRPAIEGVATPAAS
ncbi:MAG TPA: class I SAM-dependent methyltransferase [Solirubrobacteraceae bacterium]|jgi:ubiquinone/menaquinone biosynthesis C-methylase UbiE